MGKGQKEIVLETDAVELAEAAGWIVRKVQWVGRRGAPDRVFMKRKMIIWGEFKRLGEKPEGPQQREHDRMRGQGQIVKVWDNMEDFKKDLGL